MKTVNFKILIAEQRGIINAALNRIQEISDQMCVTEAEVIDEGDVFAIFWNSIESLVYDNKLWNKSDYIIKTGEGNYVTIKETSHTPIQLLIGNKYLYLNFENIYRQYAQMNRLSNGRIIPENALRHYLQKEPEFMGTSTGCRFKLIESHNSLITSPEGHGKTCVLKSMIFDYDKLIEKYNINIEIEDFKEDETKF